MSPYLAVVALLALPPAPPTASQPLGTIWQQGANSVVVIPCPPGGDHDENCRAVEMRNGGPTIQLGGGYLSVSAASIPDARPGQPVVVVSGDRGGSGGEGDLFALVFAPQAVVGHLNGERMDSIVLHPRAARLAFDLPFNIEFFNGAPHAGVAMVMLPILWADGDFVLDWKATTGRPVTVADGVRRRSMVRRDLLRWADEQPHPTGLYPPQSLNGTPGAAQALAELILTGHADTARTLLHSEWPKVNGKALRGEQAFWAGLCATIVRHPWWSRFHLDRLPRATIVRTAAATGRLSLLDT